MKILIIGNGFDKAHGLPTSYIEFLDFVDSFRKMYESGRFMWNDDKLHIIKEDSESKFTKFGMIGPKFFEEFYDIVRNSFWIDIFREQRNVIGDKWFDFENEIENLIKIMLDDKNTDKNKKQCHFSNSYVSAFCRNNNICTYTSAFELIYDELNRFNRALEIYMDGLVPKLPVAIRIPQIRAQKFDKLISFNYTCTYTEHYDAKIECDYIHGKAKLDNSETTCNIVLGFNDYYFESAETAIETVPFEKYYQRIVKRTGSKYFDWIEDNNHSDISYNYFFGHSLSPIDGDVIRQLILADRTSTIIYYMNERDRAEKIRNLAVILGPEKLIALSNGEIPVIRFERISPDSDYM